MVEWGNLPSRLQSSYLVHSVLARLRIKWIHGCVKMGQDSSGFGSTRPDLIIVIMTLSSFFYFICGAAVNEVLILVLFPQVEREEFATRLRSSASVPLTDRLYRLQIRHWDSNQVYHTPYGLRGIRSGAPLFKKLGSCSKTKRNSSSKLKGLMNGSTYLLTKEESPEKSQYAPNPLRGYTYV